MKYTKKTWVTICAMALMGLAAEAQNAKGEAKSKQEAAPATREVQAPTTEPAVKENKTQTSTIPHQNKPQVQPTVPVSKAAQIGQPVKVEQVAPEKIKKGMLYPKAAQDKKVQKTAPAEKGK